ncbi:MAG: KilA-N domain-containing protein, partial [Paramuribaculum sp.]|nr:KilA-N domain-containing protein [Paramuribaculum sp.]
DWEKSNPDLLKKHLNIRDTASINQLGVLSNLEAINAEMIKQGIERSQRMTALHRIAKEQLAVLNKTHSEHNFKKLSGNDPTRFIN